MFINDRIILKGYFGDFIAPASVAREIASSLTLRELRNDVREFWPELWKNEPAWKPWVLSLSKLELAVILKQL
jgi:hypothetical protein